MTRPPPAEAATRSPIDHLRARIWMAPESFSVAGPWSLPVLGRERQPCDHTKAMFPAQT